MPGAFPISSPGPDQTSQHNRNSVRRLAQWIIGQMRRSLPTIGKETPLETKWDANE